MDDYDRGDSAVGGVGAIDGDVSDESAAEGDVSNVGAAEVASKDVVPYTKQEVDLPDNDRLLAEKAYEDLTWIFDKHHDNAIIEAGEYIIKEFYDGDFRMARDKKSPKEGSLNQLINMMKQRSSQGPSKSWLYNAVNLAVQRHYLTPGQDASDDAKNLFQTYGKLSVSQKVCLLSVPDLEDKKQSGVST